MGKLKIGDVKFLALEGGGGKGIAYIGAIRTLEDLRFVHQNGSYDPQNPVPLFNLSEPIADRQILGISGASAGAITAFMLSLGMTSKEIKQEINKTIPASESNWKIWGKARECSPAETFLENPDVETIRWVEPKGNGFKKTSTKLAKEALSGIGNKTFGSSVYYAARLMLWLWPNDWIQENRNTVLFKRVFEAEQTLGKGFLIDLLEQTLSNLTSGMGSALLDVNDNTDTLMKYGESLTNQLGLFPGKAPREYFSQLLTDRLKILNPSLDDVKFRKDKAHSLTFLELFSITQVDLRLTGVNISHQYPFVFSAASTPDFPVVEAICISMNIPFLFKPIYVKGYTTNYFIKPMRRPADTKPVKKEKRIDKGSKNQKNFPLDGFWVDGGMLNNIPLHVFDGDGMPTKSSILVNAEGIPILDADGQQQYAEVPKMKLNGENVLGIRLTSGDEEREPPENNYMTLSKGKEEKVVEKKESELGLLGFIGKLMGTFLEVGESLQIRDQADSDKIIQLYTETMSITDFSSAKMDFQRRDDKEEGMPTKTYNMEGKAIDLGVLKRKIIGMAGDSVRVYFDEKPEDAPEE